MTDSNRGLANMNDDKAHEIQREGGRASAAKQDMHKLGKRGADHQSHDAKVRGGENSHKGSSHTNS